MGSTKIKQFQNTVETKLNWKMPPILTEEPPNNSEQAEEEQDMEEVDGDSSEAMDEEEESIDKDFEESEEFSALDRQLDELNSVLDAIEAKNDDIHGKLKQFLETSRQERLELQTSNSSISDNTSNAVKLKIQSHKTEQKCLFVKLKKNILIL